MENGKWKIENGNENKNLIIISITKKIMVIYYFLKKV